MVGDFKTGLLETTIIQDVNVKYVVPKTASIRKEVSLKHGSQFLPQLCKGDRVNWSHLGKVK
jgi:hypothetical protein